MGALLPVVRPSAPAPFVERGTERPPRHEGRGGASARATGDGLPPAGLPGPLEGELVRGRATPTLRISASVRPFTDAPPVPRGLRSRASLGALAVARYREHAGLPPAPPRLHAFA